MVDGPEEMRKTVRTLVRQGADVIKIATSGGVLSPRDKPTHGHFRDDELAALAAEAAAADVPIMAHAQATPGIKAAVRAGVRSIDHGIYLDDEAIEMMKKNGTWLVATLVAPLGVIEAADAGQAIPEASLAKAREVIDIHRDSFARAVQAGVKIAMGTDSGVTPHGQQPARAAADAERRHDAGTGADRDDAVGGAADACRRRAGHYRAGQARRRRGGAAATPTTWQRGRTESRRSIRTAGA